MRISLFPLVLMFIFSSCESKTETLPSFYHWRTNFNPEKEQLDFIDSINTNYIYVKYFDLKRNQENKIIPVAEVQFQTRLKCEVEIIPVVYITTNVFKDIDKSEIENLATNTLEKIKNLHGKNNLNEIQIDCDWTASIKDNYFYFLEKLGEELESEILTCTIRLYQYKYPNISGIPPVDKGVLMYYNMGSFRLYNEESTILNNSIGKKYLGFGNYPMHLDFALPNFSWVRLFRYGEFSQLLGSFDTDLLENEKLFEKYSEYIYTVKQDTLIDNVYLRYGDELYYDFCPKEELLKAVDLLKNEINQRSTRIIIFDLNSIDNNERDKIVDVFNAFE